MLCEEGRGTDSSSAVGVPASRPCSRSISDWTSGTLPRLDHPVSKEAASLALRRPKGRGVVEDLAPDDVEPLEDAGQRVLWRGAFQIHLGLLRPSGDSRDSHSS